MYLFRFECKTFNFGVVHFCPSVEYSYLEYARVTPWTGSYLPRVPKTAPLFDLTYKDNNDYIYTVVFTFCESSYFNLKFGVKLSKVG